MEFMTFRDVFSRNFTVTILPDHVVLNRAADLLEANGWCQGELKNSRNEMCALGAIREAAGLGVAPVFILFRLPGVRPLASAISGIADYENRNEDAAASDIVEWNDSRTRTRAEVIAMMRAVATTLRAQGNMEESNERGQAALSRTAAAADVAGDCWRILSECIAAGQRGDPLVVHRVPVRASDTRREPVAQDRAAFARESASCVGIGTS